MVICAAIKINDTVICGYRHEDCYETLHKLNSDLSLQARKIDAVIDGFLVTGNKFMDRFEAYEEAIRCGQLSAANREYKAEHKENMLFSEDLY